MAELIIVNGVPVEVPLDVAADGRAAVAKWHTAQLQKAGISHVHVETDELPHKNAGPQPHEVPPEVLAEGEEAARKWLAEQAWQRENEYRTARGWEPLAPLVAPPPKRRKGA